MDLLTFFKYAGYAILIIGAITTVATSILTDRKDAAASAQKDTTIHRIDSNLAETKELLAPFVSLAKKHFPGMSEADALDSLSKRMDLLDAEVKKGKEETKAVSDNLDKEKNTIKSLQAKVSVTISGEWEKGKIPFAVSSNFMASQTLMVIAKGNERIDFKTSGTKAAAINDNSAVEEISLTVDAGSYPVGSAFSDILLLDHLELQFPVGFPAVLHSPYLSIDEIKIELFMNGAKKGEHVMNQPTTIDINQYTKGTPYQQANTTYMVFSVHETVRKAFGMK